MAVEQHLLPMADCWVTHRTTGAAALQTDREDKNSQTCRIDPSLSERAVAHPLRQPLGMHTHFLVKDKWRRSRLRACLTEEMWRFDTLLRSGQVGSLRLCSDKAPPLPLFFFLFVPSPQTLRHRNQWSEFDWLVRSALVKAGNPRLNQSI